MTVLLYYGLNHVVDVGSVRLVNTVLFLAVPPPLKLLFGFEFVPDGVPRGR